MGKQIINKPATTGERGRSAKLILCLIATAAPRTLLIVLLFYMITSEENEIYRFKIAVVMDHKVSTIQVDTLEGEIIQLHYDTTEENKLPKSKITLLIAKNGTIQIIKHFTNESEIKKLSGHND